jgi:hypothetical protein
MTALHGCTELEPEARQAVNHNSGGKDEANWT